jgi:hypothetical protein
MDDRVETNDLLTGLDWLLNCTSRVAQGRGIRPDTGTIMVHLPGCFWARCGREQEVPSASNAHGLPADIPSEFLPNKGDEAFNRLTVSFVPPSKPLPQRRLF